MIIKHFIFTEVSWTFVTENNVFEFSSIDDAENFINENKLSITLRGCLI